jgi:glucose/arabinose dehydrogenase
MKRLSVAIGIAALAAPVILLAQAVPSAVRCDPDNGGLKLSSGFCALVVADATGSARHLVVSSSGDVYVALRNQQNAPGAIVALRDTNGDGRADVREKFGELGGTGILLQNGYLYMSRDDAVVRFPMKEGQLLPAGPVEVVVSGFPQQRAHATKSLTFDNRGGLYVNVGNPSNACTEPDQTRTAGLNPCTQQEHAGGVWRFDANRIGQIFEKDGTRYMKGLRQTNSLRWNPTVNALYLVQHGRGGLNRWPEYFNDQQNADLPSEEFLRIEDGSTFSFPYCYHDLLQGKRFLSPEYGGDGKTVGDCDKYPAPVAAYPGHWAPNDLLFYTGSQFPRKYSGGALIAFHGSGDRTPLPQAGYTVVFQPMQGGKASGNYEILADGFTGKDVLMKREEAAARPMGLAQGPDGSLYISDSVKGKIWRVMYRGTTTTSSR